jgi:hypothetical protein
MIRPLAFPKAQLKLTKKGEKLFVWCVVRKKTLLLTPEEWVRQHLIHYLINDKQIPPGLIAAEMPLRINNLDRRCDVVVYDRSGSPVLIVECKAPEVGLDEKVFQQIAQYNFGLGVDLLMVTNGLYHVYCRIDREEGRIVGLEELPDGICG